MRNELQQHGERFEVVGIVAGSVGTTNTSVLLFAAIPTAVGSQPLASFCAWTNDNAAGSSFKLTRRGLYSLEFVAPTAAVGGTILAGITVDASPGLLTGNPLRGSVPSPVLSSAQRFKTDADVDTLTIKTDVRVTQAQAETPGVQILRCQASDGFAGPPVGLATSQVYLTVTRMGDLNDVS